MALLLGVVYFQQEYNQEGIMNINGALFIILSNITFVNAFSVVNVSTSKTVTNLLKSLVLSLDILLGAANLRQRTQQWPLRCRTVLFVEIDGRTSILYPSASSLHFNRLLYD